MNNNLRSCLDEALNVLHQFEEMHTVGKTASDAELDLIYEASSNLAEASEIVGELDNIRVNGRRRYSIHLELEQQSKDLRGSAKLMQEYQTESSSDAKMPTAYDTVMITLEWIEEFL